MARYIDADDLKAVIYANDWSNPVVPDVVGVIIDRSPTADVAPRAEVDRLRFNLKAVLDERAEDKAEVAREILQEVRKAVLSLILANAMGEIFDLEKRFSEIEKKYTEADHDPS